MASLRDFTLLNPVNSRNASVQNKLAIYHSSVTSVTNGGCCCCWVVPSGVSWATFEVWGSGGTGAGACCCMGPYVHGGTGHYGIKTIAVTAGNFFCTCAASTTCCNTSCCGSCGLPSYVICGNGVSAICASGGAGSCTGCWRSYQGCAGICYPSCDNGCGVSGQDMAISAMASPTKESNYCWGNMWSFASGSAVFGNNFRTGSDYCTTNLTISGCTNSGAAAFPGGGGNTARACGGGCCHGGWGAGGLVLITYG